MPSSTFVDCIDKPGRLVNLHYFNPAMVMKLVEIVRGPHTGDDTVKALQWFVSKIGKQSILVNKEIEGFVVNRLLRAVQNEGFFLLKEGIATFEDIDTAAEKGLNYPMGPFRLQDFTGLDIGYYNRMKKYDETGDPADLPPQEMIDRFKRGEFGKKTGKGWYTYEK
jgi:3-hydroxybutyryl-CoA dehydrogenase